MGQVSPVFKDPGRRRNDLPSVNAFTDMRRRMASVVLRCAAGLDGCTGRAVHVHHRKLRSQGGPDSPENLIPVCNSCHTAIHAHPADSYERGLMIRSGEEVTPL